MLRRPQNVQGRRVRLFERRGDYDNRRLTERCITIGAIGERPVTEGSSLLSKDDAMSLSSDRPAAASPDLHAAIEGR